VRLLSLCKGEQVAVLFQGGVKGLNTRAPSAVAKTAFGDPLFWKNGAKTLTLRLACYLTLTRKHRFTNLPKHRKDAIGCCAIINNRGTATAPKPCISMKLTPSYKAGIQARCGLRLV